MFNRCIIVLVCFVASGCASTLTNDSSDIVQASFGPEANPIEITTEEQFKEVVVGNPLILVSDGLNATLEFESNNKASGKIVRESNASEDMNLDWEWVDSGYCRTGIIGEVRLDRRCESVELIEDVGLRLSYDDGESPDEYWIFSSYHQSLVQEGKSSCDLIADPVQAELCRQQ